MTTTPNNAESACIASLWGAVVATRDAYFAAAGAGGTIDVDVETARDAWRAARGEFRAVNSLAGAVRAADEDGVTPESSDAEATAWISTWWTPPNPADPAVAVMNAAGVRGDKVREAAADIAAHATRLRAEGLRAAAADDIARRHGLIRARYAVEEQERRDWRSALRGEAVAS